MTTLWHLVKQSTPDYGETVEVIVNAETSTDARILAGKYMRENGSPSHAFDWVDPDLTTIRAIGTADAGENLGVVMTKESPN
jgi:hypothetical protein